MTRHRRLEHAERHLRALYEIGKQLTAFESAERTLPGIIQTMVDSLPLRTVVFLERWGEEVAHWAWSAPGVDPAEVAAARARADWGLGYLSGPPPKEGAEPGSAQGSERYLTLPLVVERGQTFGVLQVGALLLEPVRALDRVDLAFVNAVAVQLAIALDRAEAWRLLIEREQAGRHRAEARQLDAEAKRSWAEQAELREHLVAEVSAALAEPLGRGTDLERVAHLMVPRLADCVVIELAVSLEPQPARSAVVAVGCASPEEAARLRGLVGRPEEVDLLHGPPGVVRSGLPELYPPTPSPAPAALGPEHPLLLRESRATSSLCLPLKLRGVVAGTMTLLYAGSGRHYSARDLGLAEDLAWRVATAVDNAQLYQEARWASRTREDLLAIVAHDLKNPLSVIQMAAQHQLRLFEANPAAPGLGHARVIYRSAVTMAGLIRDLLDSASIEAGRLSVTLRREPVLPLLTEAVEALQPAAQAKALHLELEAAPDLPAVLADRARVQQILANLLGNAAKFTPPSGRISVRAERSGGVVQFSVADSGPGIPAAELPHLFDRYWQAKRTAKLGTGLGLYIARGIVQTHGGAIWAESEPGRGSTFFFTLPLAPEAATPAPSALH